MDFCEAHCIHYLFGLTGTKPLQAKLREIADAVATTRAVDNADRVRDFAEVRHKANSWRRECRAVARIEATLDCARDSDLKPATFWESTWVVVGRLISSRDASLKLCRFCLMSATAGWFSP